MTNPFRWFIGGNSSYISNDIHSFKHGTEDDVLVVEFRAWARTRRDQKLHIVVIGIEFDLLVVVVLGQAQRERPRSRVLQLERPRVDGLHVPREVRRRPDLPLLPSALAAGDEELALEDLVNEGAAVGGGGARGLEIGNSLGDKLAIEAEDDAAKGLGVGAGGEVRAQGAVGAEVAWAEAEVHEDAFGDDGGGGGGRGGGRGRGIGLRGGGEREERGGGGGREEEERPAVGEVEIYGDEVRVRVWVFGVRWWGKEAAAVATVVVELGRKGDSGGGGAHGIGVVDGMMSPR